jgi:F-type H+-transporting ATPase subunit alpha
MGRLAEGILDVEPGLRPALGRWAAGLRQRFAEMAPPGAMRAIGRILHVADGVATVAGLPEARFNELLRFPGDVYGMVFNLDPDRMGCVLLGPDTHLAAGDTVERTGHVASVPVGEGLLGRVVDAIGTPLDGEGPLDAADRWPVEREAPAILERAPVTEQLVTGLKAIDALIPIGQGQRELIVGDRATGKTAVAVDAILNQRGSKILSIYAAIGQKAASVKTIAENLRRHGALESTIIVAADADDVHGLKYLAPYAATAMGEYLMHRGHDVLIVYDDLTRHARAYRELSLLLRRPPGREAYPGDIFFVHSRLLERATRLREETGGGSLTALPIVETQAKNMSAYIPTNLISITDGQILLDPDLFAKGVKPAIDVGRSVSRVGGKAQLPAIRHVAGELRLQYAQFEELELFTRFGASVEEETRRKIARGHRIRELLKQVRLDPLSAAEEVALLLSVQCDAIDRVPVERVRDFDAALRRSVRERLEGGLADRIARGEALEDGDWSRLEGLIRKTADDFGERAGADDGATDGRQDGRGAEGASPRASSPAGAEAPEE